MFDELFKSPGSPAPPQQPTAGKSAWVICSIALIKVEPEPTKPAKHWSIDKGLMTFLRSL